jgi:hypothetical protein
MTKINLLLERSGASLVVRNPTRKTTQADAKGMEQLRNIMKLAPKALLDNLTPEQIKDLKTSGVTRIEYNGTTYTLRISVDENEGDLYVK